jgi:hypothetical protein
MYHCNDDPIHESQISRGVTYGRFLGPRVRALPMGCRGAFSSLDIMEKEQKWGWLSTRSGSKRLLYPAETLIPNVLMQEKTDCEVNHEANI